MEEEIYNDVSVQETDDDAEDTLIKRPWSLREVIYGILAMILISGGIVIVANVWEIKSNLILIIYELIYLLPVIVVMLIKKAKWSSLGLNRFSFENLMVGFGIMVAAYIVIIIHNVTLALLGIAPQSEYLMALFDMDIDLWVLGVAIVIAAPIAEEIFFRSFVYGGLEKKYGWQKAMWISALIFGAAHMQLVAFIPTFLMGLVLAYIYQRSRSVIPSMILHFAVNGFGFAMIYLFMLLEDSLPF